MIVYSKLGEFGRLGNQLFQIAATISHAKKVNEKAQFPEWQYNKYLLNPIDDNLDTSFDEKFNGIDHEPYYGLKFEYSPIPLQKNIILYGFYQSEKYFDKQLVLNTFKPKPELLKVVREAGDRFLWQGNLIAAHIRRSDYLDKPDYHPVLPLEYYQKATDVIGRSLVIVFSDDIAWCKKNIHGPNIMFAEGNSEIVDLYLMAHCKHHIIANSSFSWWGAWLSKLFHDKPGITVAPETWFGPACNYDTKDLYCPDWKVI